MHTLKMAIITFCCYIYIGFKKWAGKKRLTFAAFMYQGGIYHSLIIIDLMVSFPPTN